MVTPADSTGLTCCPCGDETVMGLEKECKKEEIAKYFLSIISLPYVASLGDVQ